MNEIDNVAIRFLYAKLVLLEKTEREKDGEERSRRVKKKSNDSFVGMRGKK